MRGQATLTKDEAEKLVQSACAAMSAELARLRAELEQARVQLAGCLCAAEGTGDADKVKQGDYAWTPALQRTVELRVALEEAHAQTKDIKSDLVALGKDANEMIADKGRLRADLAEARADVARFEAALDAANKELAQARAERDEAIERRSVTVASEENLRFLKQLWEQECGYYRAKWWASHQANDRSRATIAALVVAFRCAMLFVKTADMKWLRAAIKIERGRANQTTHD